MAKIPPKKRKTARSSLRRIAEKLRLPFDTTRSVCCNWPLDDKGCSRCGDVVSGATETPAAD